MKRKSLRANHATYISKTSRISILKRFYLKKIYFKKRRDHSLKAYNRLYKRQRENFCSSINPFFVKIISFFGRQWNLFSRAKGKLDQTENWLRKGVATK